MLFCPHILFNAGAVNTSQFGPKTLVISRKIFRFVTQSIASISLLAILSLGFSQASYAQSSRPQCSSAVLDLDGDGWGYENNRSCVMPTGHPTCSSSAIIHDGWGFENGRSCRAASGSSTSSAASSQSSSRHPTCSSSAVLNGDGWGFENGRSCVESAGSSSSASSSSSSGSQVPSCSAAAINNGDGWGWENNASCRYSGNTSSSSSTSASSNNASNNSSGFPECSANADDNGDGFGFEFGATCIWGSVRPNTNRNSLVAAPPPVTVAAIGFENGDPICLTDASDGNSDGFGYENDRSCRVVAGRTATSQNPLLNTRWCQPWAEISYGDYVLQNNTWNFSDVYSNRWSQCIELTGSRGNYVAEWDYNWLDRHEGNEFSVKSYPQVYYGRKTRNSQSGTPAKLGLPVNVNNLPNYKVRYRYSETGNAERNVALESFFHTSCEAEEWNKHFEMMVWVGKPVIKTPGRLVAEATIDGKEWDVYTNPALGWGYVAFVEKQSSTQGWLDWKKFVDWTRFQGPRYGVWDVGNTCMGAIEIGTETFWGNGTFRLDEFRVTR